MTDSAHQADVRAVLARLRETVAGARSRPGSTAVRVDRDTLLGLVEELDAGLEQALEASREVVAEREALLARAGAEADRIVAEAGRERDKLVSDTDVYRAARRQADVLLERAREDDRAMRAETDAYVDAKLANFEVTLTRTTEAVRRGRERLAGQAEQAGAAEPDLGTDG
ncbi:MAG: hypothetical protein WB441_02800 [Nocardioidaceae bacterium]